jgi:aminoglycoside 6'-N-acetyltransferase I
MKPASRVLHLRVEDTLLIDELTLLVHEAFAEYAPGWLPTLADAKEEITDSLKPNKISRVMLNEQNRPVGWIGVIRQNSGRVWEIHPAMVAKSEQGKGYGSALVRDIEQLARVAGVLTLCAGTSDQTNASNLSGIDLFEDPVGAIARIQSFKQHPYQFWIACGFTIVGVVPDAEGIGKPGILLAKRVS